MDVRFIAVLVGLIGGPLLLSLQFGWKVGIGIGLLCLYMKSPEKH